MSLDPSALAPSVRDKSIIVGVSGGIACYKTATLVSRLAQAGAHVTVLMTEAATRFITPLTFQSLSGSPVYTSLWDHIENSDPQHIALADRADAVIVAPCTMDLLARLAHGQTSDVITLMLSAVDRLETPVLLAPAMNDAMWRQPATQRNIAMLSDDGFQMIGPGVGWQACRHVGTGRMSEPAEIAAALIDVLAADRLGD